VAPKFGVARAVMLEQGVGEPIFEAVNGRTNSMDKSEVLY
jgi:hypothetical protein